MEITRTLFMNKMASLSPELREVVSSDVTSALIHEIAIQNQITKEQRSRLASETIYLLMDLRTKGEFIDKLKASGLPQEKADKLLADVTSHILDKKATIATAELSDEEFDRVFSIDLASKTAADAALDFLDAKLGNRPPQPGSQAATGQPAPQQKPAANDPYREPLA